MKVGVEILEIKVLNMSANWLIYKNLNWVLSELDLEYSSLNDKGLIYIKYLKNLKVLYLKFNDFSLLTFMKLFCNLIYLRKVIISKYLIITD